MRSKRQRIMSTACTSNRQKACVANTGKGNHGRLQAPGGQREKRAIPPDGFTVFSPGQCCRICQSIIGRTMFAPTVFLFKSHRSMWASTPTVITQLQLRGKGNYGVCKPRRTARETSDSAGRFHGIFPRTVLPNMSKYHRANDVRPYSIPFQEPQVDVGIAPYSNNAVTIARQVPARATMAFASPRRTARAASDSAGRFHGVFPRAVLPNTSKYHRANHEKTHLTAVRCVFSGIEYIKLLERCQALLFPHQDICAGINCLHLLRIDRLQKADIQRGVPVIR